ncbi:LOW QUALITY PROTEIN: dynein regulatory complex subunit 3 [Menidia menidia]
MDSVPIAINEGLLQETVMKKIGDIVCLISTTERIYFHEILDLNLAYKNIFKIDLLQDFKSLVRLDLNNNVITEIRGLDSLTNLQWLNLSFNRVEKIEGLESLRKLEMLNLSSNKITRIENMDTLENLRHLLIANNLLSQLDNVLYLRRFKKLFKLYMTGNPVTEEEDYVLFIAAYFPSVMFLDRILINKKIRQDAFTKYKYILEKMKNEELQKQAVANQSCENEQDLHKDAFVEFLNGSYLFNSMCKDDPEAERLCRVPGVAPLMQTYPLIYYFLIHVNAQGDSLNSLTLWTFESQIVELCTNLFDIGLAQHKQRETELNSFFSGQNEIQTYYRNEASQVLATFEEHHKESIMELPQLSDPVAFEEKLSHHEDEITQLYNSLLTLEFEMDGKLEDNIRKLDSCISDMVGNFSETAQGIFAQCRDLEDSYYQKMQEIASALLDRVAKENLEEDIPDDVVSLFTDKDSVVEALATSHDNHLLTINDRDNQLVIRVNHWEVSLIKEIREKVIQQSHTRISDVNRYVDHLRNQLSKLQQHSI